MEILVVSDTHGRTDRLLELIGRTGAKELFFLGDGLRDLDALDGRLDVCAVRGNCDWTGVGDAPLSRCEARGGVRFFLTHGHLYDVRHGLDAALCAAAGAGADVLLYGHTHVPFHTMLPAGTEAGGRRLQKPMQVVCPGSLGAPREGGPPAFATLTLLPSGVLAGFGALCV